MDTRLTPADGLRPYSPRDQRDVLATAARAFTVDPMFGYFFRDRLRAHQSLPALLNGFLRDVVDVGVCQVVEGDDGIIGFAGWLPPAATLRTVKRDVRLVLHSARGLVGLGHLVGGARLVTQIERRHPKAAHWYLALLVVDPEWQGRGYGGQLIRPGVERADLEGLPCYLETQKEGNVSWYARFGFELTDTIEVPGVPPVWCLTRPAR